MDIEDWSDDAEWLGPDEGAAAALALDEPPDGRGLLGLADPALVRVDLDRDRRRPALPSVRADQTPRRRVRLATRARAAARGAARRAAATRSRTSSRCGTSPTAAKRVFSPERWCLTGDAGAFLDPFFSPGSDFIGICNSFITDLVTTDLDGGPIDERAEFSNDFYLRYFETWLSHYQDLYPLFGNPFATSLFFSWYRAAYFPIPVLLFYEGKLADPDFLRQVKDELDRFMLLVPRVQELVREWHALERRGVEGVLIKPVEPVPMMQWVHELMSSHDPNTPPLDDETLKAAVAERLRVLEAIAVVFFHEAASYLDTPVDDDAVVNPYAVSLRPENWERDGLFGGKGMTVAEAQALTPGMQERLEELRAAAPAMA